MLTGTVLTARTVFQILIPFCEAIVDADEFTVALIDANCYIIIGYFNTLNRRL